MSVSPDVHSVPNMKSQISPTVDSEREEFRKYLESSGVLDVLTRICKEMYEKEEKPSDALKYFTDALGAVNFHAREIVALKDEIEALTSTVVNLEKENSYLREKLDKFCEFVTMVRVKYRYILAELWTEQFKNKLKLPVREKELKQAILDSVENLHGDYGVACVTAGFSIKMYNPATRIFIVRVLRKFHSILGSSLPFITTIGKVKLGIRTLRLSGTIRGVFKFLIQYDKEKLTEMVQMLQLSDEVEKELAEMIGKCHKRLSKEEARY